MAESKINKQPFAVIILAAGKSSRLGSPKQLLNYKGKNLLQLSIDAALESFAEKVIVVLGAEKEQIEQNLDQSKIYLIHNKNWQSGMASSIHSALENLKSIIPNAQGAIFMVCDQPFVNAELLNKLIEKHLENGKKIIASSYDDTLGTPSLFHKNLFQELSELKGDVGAKSLIKKYKDDAESVAFELGSIDIDTRENYLNLLK